MLSLDEIKTILEEDDRRDAGLLVKIENNLDRDAELYDEALKWMPAATKEPGIHLHAHGATPLFETTLGARMKTMHILGMQPNKTMAKMTAETLQSKNSVDSSFKQVGKNCLIREYSLDDKRLQKAPFQTIAPALWTIHDHIRSANVLRAILGGQKIQSASMLFPPVTTVMLHEAPYTYTDQKMPIQEYVQRSHDITARMLNAMFLHSAEFMEPGGTLVLGWLARKKGKVGTGHMYLPDANKWKIDPQRPGKTIGSLPYPFENYEAVIARFILKGKIHQ